MKDFEISDWIFWALLIFTFLLSTVGLGLVFADFIISIKGIY